MLGGKPSRSDLDHTDVLSRRPFHGLQGRNHECRKVCRSCRRTRGSPRNRRSILHRPASRLGDACRQRVVSGGVRPVVKLRFGGKRFSENRQSGIEQHRTVERPQAVYPVQCGGQHRRRRQHFKGPGAARLPPATGRPTPTRGLSRHTANGGSHGADPSRGDTVTRHSERRSKGTSSPQSSGVTSPASSFASIPPQRHGSESYGYRRPARAVGGRDAASVVEP